MPRYTEHSILGRGIGEQAAVSKYTLMLLFVGSKFIYRTCSSKGNLILLSLLFVWHAFIERLEEVESWCISCIDRALSHSGPKQEQGTCVGKDARD